MISARSSVLFEPPDTTVWRFEGDISEEAMRGLTFREKQLVEGRPYLLKLVDMRRVGNISAGARKASVEKVHEVPVLGVAIFGASFPLRVLANFVVRAGSIMRKVDTVPTQFFETEQEGRAWLATKRDEQEVSTRSSSKTH